MNKKAILKEVAKTQTIKNLLDEGYSPSLLHRLIVEEFLNESSKKFPEINPFQQGDRRKHVADKFYNDTGNAEKYVKDFDKNPSDYSDKDREAVRDLQAKLQTHVVKNSNDDQAIEMLNAINRIEAEKGVELSSDELETVDKAIKKLKQQAIKQLMTRAQSERDTKKRAQEVIKIVAALDGNPDSVSKKDVDSYKDTETSKLDGMSLKDILDGLKDEQDSSANRDDLMEANDSSNLLNKFVTAVKDKAGFNLDLSQLNEEESKSLEKYLSIGRNLESTVAEFRSLLSSKIPDIEPAAQNAMNVEFDPDDEEDQEQEDQEQEDQEQEDQEDQEQEEENTESSATPTVSEDAVIAKKAAAKIYEERAEEQINTFLDEFMTTKTLRQQVKMFTDLNSAFDSLKTSLQDPEIISINESKKRTINEDTRSDLVKKAEKEVLEKLKGLKSILASLEGGTTTVIGQMQKMQVVKVAQEIQAGLKQLFDAIQNPSSPLEERLIKEEDDPMKLDTREKKIQYVKSTFNRLEPKLIQLDDTLTSFDDEEGATVDLLPIIKLIDDSKTELNKLAIFFDQSSTYFTKNKISIKKLNRRFKQLVRAYISIVKRLDAAEDATDKEQVLQQIKKISKVVEKYLGAASTLDGASTEPASPSTGSSSTNVPPEIIRTLEAEVQTQMGSTTTFTDRQISTQDPANLLGSAFDAVFDDLVSNNPGVPEQDIDQAARQVISQQSQENQEEQGQQTTDTSGNLRNQVSNLLPNDQSPEVIDLVTEYLKFLQGDDNLSESIIYENKKPEFDREKYQKSVKAFIKRKIEKNELSNKITSKQILDKLELMFNKDSDKFNELFSLKSINKKLGFEKLKVWASKEVNQEALVNPRLDEEGTPMYLQNMLEKGYRLIGLDFSKDRDDKLDTEILKVIYEAIETGPFKEMFKIHSNIEIEFKKELEKALGEKNNWGQLQGLKKANQIANELYDIIDPIFKAREERFDLEMDNDKWKLAFSSGVFGVIGMSIGAVAVPFASIPLGMALGTYMGALGGNFLFPKLVSALSINLGGRKQFDEEAIKTKGIVKAFLDAITPETDDLKQLKNTKKALESVLYIKQTMLAMFTSRPKKTEGKEQYLMALREVGAFFENDVLYTAKNDLNLDLDAADILHLFYDKQMDEQKIDKKIKEIDKKIKEIEKGRRNKTKEFPLWAKGIKIGDKYTLNKEDFEDDGNKYPKGGTWKVIGKDTDDKEPTSKGKLVGFGFEAVDVNGTKQDVPLNFKSQEAFADLFTKAEGSEEKPKQEQIERKLETIIEHYLNTGKL